MNRFLLPWSYGLATAFLCLALSAAGARAGFGLPAFHPHFDTHLPKIKAPDLSHLDPTKKLKEEWQHERSGAMRQLRKLDPAELQRQLQASLQQRINDQLKRQKISYDQATGTLDLRSTRVGTTLNGWIHQLAQGNRREGGLDELSYNLKSQDLVLRLHVRHRQSWGKVIPGLGPVDLYDVTQTARLHYNFQSESGDFNINLGPLGPQINSTGLERLSQGDLVGAAEAMSPSVVGAVMHFERKDEYQKHLSQLQARYGAGNVYFASKGFVDWATPETAGNYIVNGVITGGASVFPQIMADVKQRARAEAAALSAWLKSRGMSNAEAAAEELLTGRKPRWPFLKFEMLPVRYSSREKPLGAVATPWISVNHLAFAIVWQNGG